MQRLPWVIKPIVPEEVYTDREEFLEYFYNAALNAARRRTGSTVLLGQRRMGKTEIFKRVVNRLFFEQNPKSKNAVVPVYYCFPDTIKDENHFAVNYFENFMRYYVGFYTCQPEFILNELSGNELVSAINRSKKLYPFTKTLDWILGWHKSIIEGRCNLPHFDALKFVRRVSDVDDSTIVMFLDEFQNTRLPQYEFDIVGYMQEAVESPTCPHFVTGSAMSILAKEIIGRGSLFGRFDSEKIGAMSEYWGAQLAYKAAEYYGAKISEIMLPVVSDRCGGNPFYITAIIKQAAKQEIKIDNEQTLNRILAVDLSSGFIWGELNDQVNRWMERINEHGITKWILYLSALDENVDYERKEEISLARIQEELKKREGKNVSINKIREVLILLSRGDLLEYLELGGWFRRIKDPILLEFLKVWGKIEVEKQNPQTVKDDLERRYMKLKRQISEYKGYLAEVHISQILLNSQNKTLPGKYFNSNKDIKMPWRFTFVEHRYRPGSGKGREIDVYGAAGLEAWVCQSKWLNDRKAGVNILKNLLKQAKWIEEEDEDMIVTCWIFAHNGLTGQAKKFAKEHGILWSSKKEFNELLEYLGLRALPGL